MRRSFTLCALALASCAQDGFSKNDLIAASTYIEGVNYTCVESSTLSLSSLSTGPVEINVVEAHDQPERYAFRSTLHNQLLLAGFIEQSWRLIGNADGLVTPDNNHEIIQMGKVNGLVDPSDKQKIEQYSVRKLPEQALALAEACRKFLKDKDLAYDNPDLQFIDNLTYLTLLDAFAVMDFQRNKERGMWPDVKSEQPRTTASRTRNFVAENTP